MSPEERFDGIERSFGERIEALTQEALSLAEPSSPQAERYRRERYRRLQRIYDIADEQSTMVADSTICKRGCSHCCHQSVQITEYEANRIAAHARLAKGDPQQLDSDNEAEYKAFLQAKQTAYMQTPCPFLSGNECSIYSHRPMICRITYSLADDPDICNIYKDPHGVIPYLQNQGLLKAHLVLAFFSGDGERCADIREWFPGVKEGKQSPAKT